MKLHNLVTKIIWNDKHSNATKCYAIELLYKYAEQHGDEIERLTEKDLLSGAPNWQRYSEGACSLVWIDDIAERATGIYKKPEEIDSDKAMKYQAEHLKDAWRLIYSIMN